MTANQEVLEGLWEGKHGEIAAFKGIPFASPPVGELRWQKPKPPVPREGLQKAVKFAPACMQGEYTRPWYVGVAAAFGHGPESISNHAGVSEDCLYLNIWSPDLQTDAKLPVMIWFHGGSNKSGWSYEPNYLGANLAAKGVVVVTVAYRVGPFGFFSHPLLDNGENEPVANFGWLDGEAALRWVSAHIENFGGDRENITVIGESSGAGNIADLIAADIIDLHLYHRSIIQSSGGSLTGRRTLADEQEVGRRLIAGLGIEEAGLSQEQLREIPAEDLQRVSEQVLPGHYFDVVIDDLTFLSRPLETYDTTKVSSIDVLIGTNKHEWYMYINEAATIKDLDQWLTKNASHSAAILRSKVRDEPDVRRAIDRLRTAKDTLCPSRYLAARVSAAGGRGWVYYFSRQRPGPGGEKLGAYHGTEIPYVFNTHDDWLPTEEADVRLTEAVMDYWVQFARSGDPNVQGRPEWPLHQASDPRVMELGDHIGAIPPPDADLCLWLDPRR